MPTNRTKTAISDETRYKIDFRSPNITNFSFAYISPSGVVTTAIVAKSVEWRRKANRTNSNPS